MKCLEREQLFNYASRLLDEPEMTRVRTHVEACSHCQEIVNGYAQVDAALAEWKPVEPSAWFDARVRQAVKTQSAPAAARGFKGLQWIRGLAVAALGVLVISGVVWYGRGRRVMLNPASLATRPSNQAAPVTAPPEVAQVKSPEVVTPHHSKTPVQAAAVTNSAVSPALDDEDAVTADDDALIANFDVLSEIPKTETRSAN